MTDVSTPGSKETVDAARIKWRWPSGLTLSVMLISVLVALPIVAVVVNIFAPSEGLWVNLVRTVLPTYLINTVILMVGVGVFVTMIGTGAAWLVTMCRFPGRGVVEWALVLPFAVPAYVLAYVYTDLMEYAGPIQTWLRELFEWGRRDYWFPNIRSLPGAIAMLAMVLYPYVYLLARTAFLNQSAAALEVSRALGYGPWRSFWKVALRMGRPGIVAGLALALMETLADFGTVDFFGVQTFTTGIYRTWFLKGSPVVAAQLASCLLVFVMAVMLAERLSRGDARYHGSGGRFTPLPSYALKGPRAWLALALCVLPVLCGFLVPGAILLEMAIQDGDPLFDSRFLRYAFSSISVAAMASILAVAAAVILGYGTRLNPSPLARLATRVASMGYAIPGSVIAVGILIPFGLFDNWLDGLTREYLGVSVGLVLTGGIVGLLFAYVVRFLAVAFNAVEAGLTKITPSMDGAARSLGHGPIATLVKIHVPLLRASLLTGILLVFVDVMKELPATLIVRPFNFETLATRVYRLASDERLSEASTAALAIVVAGVLPVILLSWQISRSRPGMQADVSRASKSRS
ncbi:MAG: iron ABC transporter permease [Pseudomonadota bacterium]